MDAKQIKLDGSDILKDWVSGIYYVQKEWRNNLQVSDLANDRSGWHGRDVSPTFARVRIITLEGLIDRLPYPALEQSSTEYLEQLFALQSNPSILTPRTLYVKDIYNREWTLSVKVKEPCMIEEGDGEYKGSHWKWRVVLESIGDPSYLSYGEFSQSGIEWATGGWAIPIAWFSLAGGFPLSESMNLLTIVPTGNTAVFPRFLFTVTSTLNTPLRIKNLGTLETFSLDVSCVAGDTITIDSQNQKCTKNGVDITSQRVAWSLWPSALASTTYLIDDADGGSMGSDFSVIVYYKNALL